MSLAHALLLFAQVGPNPVQPSLPTGLEQRLPRPAPANPAAPADSPLGQCLAAASDDPPAAADLADEWAERTKGLELAEAQFCLGTAKAALGHWDEAEQAFAAGRAAAPGASTFRARLGAMAGTAALAQDVPDRALPLLDDAHADALAVGNAALAGDIAVDRSRALVALKRSAEAEQALAEARQASPANPDAWLLSATLARRAGKLDEAQPMIERAADLAPRDPFVGLEAGVIAVLDGRDDAARKSWQSVIAAAPDSPAASTAKGYREQLAGLAPAAR